jgi:phosphotransferase system IIB component
VLGRSAIATSAILSSSFGIAGALKGAGWLTKFAGQVLGTGGVSGEIEYSHSFLEYLKSKGMDVNDPESIQKFINDKKLIEEAKDYSLKRGAIIGSIDGLTGGMATKIIAPSVITRANRSVLPYLKKPVGTSVNPSTRHAINFMAQTPLQTGLPAGAEYFAQLATLEEGEKISMGEVLAEAMGEAVFVPADMALGAFSARNENLTLKQIKEEKFNSVVEYLQITKEQGKQLGLEDLAGEIAVGEDQTIYDTGIPYFNEAFDIYQQNANKISLTANTDANIIAPNQFFVEPDGQGKFLILDTYNEKFGNIYDSQEEAAGISGSLNAISGASYSTELKNQYATMQGLNVDAETNPLVNKLGNAILNPYFGQIDIEDINQSSNVNSAAYERLINVVGKDATGIDVLSLQGVLPETDINRLLDIKAKKLYQDANVGKNLPSNITIKMFENLGKKLNLNIDTTSNGFKSLALRLTGQPNVNKLNNAQKRLVYSFLNTLPQHEGTTVSLPDFSSRPYTLNEYNQVVDSLNSGNSPTIPNIITALGLNPNDINDKRTATRLRQDLVSAGIIDKKGSKYKFNVNGEWSLNRAQQVAIESDPQTKTDLKEIQKFRSLLSEQFKKMGLPEISLKIENAVQNKVGQINPQAEGQFDPIWSEVFLNVAKAKEGTTSEQEVIENLSQTLGHELFHAAKFLDLFSIQEINNLNNFVKNNELNAASAETLLGKDNLKILTDSLGRTPTYLEAIEFRYNTLDNQNLNNEALLEEANALLFEDHINNKRKLAGQPRALMERTKKFFSTVNNGLNELGFQTYEDVFDKLVSGEIGTRERTNKTQQSFEVTRMDEYGRPQGSYEVEPRVVRTNRILENEFSEILRVSETSVGNEYLPESADRDSPMFQRPLQDAPNLKFKLANTQQRPTTLTQEYWRGAQNEEYGNDINQIGETIFAKNIVNNTDIIRRLGRTLENSEIGTTQGQLYEITQKFLKNAKNYPETFSMYVVGDLNRSTSGTVATNNLEEAENIANEFVNPPFKILGDRKKITEYTVNRPQVMLDKDVMFGAKPPVWAQPSLPSTDYLLIGSSALATSPNQPISYQERTPPKGIIKRQFNLGTLKPKYKMSGMEFLSSKGSRGKQITDNLRTYRNSIDLIGQASLQERTLNKKLKLSEPLDDIAFKNAKEDLLKLMNQGLDVLSLADHPALTEGMSRMAEIQTTADQYLNKLGEDWFLNKSYINNRKFVINNKSVNGIRKAIAESIKKAES